MSIIRLTQQELPSYRFLPGITPHPFKDPQGHMYLQSEPNAKPIQTNQWQESQEYLYALDLLNHGFFWESHVWLEAIWNAHKRQGEIANLCKALIKIGAAGVKWRKNQTQAALGHLQRSKELIEIAFEQTDPLIGLSYLQLNEVIEKSIQITKQKTTSTTTFPSIIPQPLSI